MVYLVPLLIVLRIKDFKSYKNFIDGNDNTHLIKIFKEINISDFHKSLFFDKDDTSERSEIIIIDKLSLLYSAIFINNFSKKSDFVKIGQFVINGNTKHSILHCLNLLDFKCNLPYLYQEMKRGGVLMLGNSKTGEQSVYHPCREDFLATDWEIYDDEQ